MISDLGQRARRWLLPYTVLEVPPERVQPLRHQVLRPGLPFETAVWARDQPPESRHFAALDLRGRVVGVASFYPEPTPLAPGEPAWQLRGMAVELQSQGHGVGRLVLREALATLLASDPRRVVWCNARVGAIGFYEHLGFRAHGEPFLVPNVLELHRFGVWRAALA